jgi:hypothetical protein
MYTLCCGVIRDNNYFFGAGIKHKVYSEKTRKLNGCCYIACSWQHLYMTSGAF